MKLLSTRLVKIINHEFKLAENCNATLFRRQKNQLSAVLSANWPELEEKVLPQLSKIPRYYAKSMMKSGRRSEFLTIPEVLPLSDYVAIIKDDDS